MSQNEGLSWLVRKKTTKTRVRCTVQYSTHVWGN